MKINILYTLLLSMLSLTATAKEFGFINTNGTPLLQNVINNDIVNVRIIIGKTYSASLNNYNIITSTNNEVSLKFASDTSIKCNENTSLNIDNYEQNTIHTTYPQETQYTDYSCNVSLLSGEVEVINNGIVNDTNNFYMNTRLACIIFGKGKFVVKSSNTSSTFIVIEGNATVMDTSSRKLYKIKDKDVISFTPRPLLSGKAGEQLRKQSFATTSQLESDDYKVLSTEFNTFQNEQRQYIFVTTDSANKLVKLK